MVRSAAKPCVRRTIGGEVALSDPVLRADVVEVGIDDGVHVAEGVEVVLAALLGVVPVVGRRDEVEFYQTMIPAKAAIGLSPEGEDEARFGVSDEGWQSFEGRAADLASTHGAANAGDHEDHQRPEADHDAQQGRDVTQQPEGPAFAFHGRQYTSAGSPAGLRDANPPNFSGKSLRSLETRKSYPPNLRRACPTKWGVTRRCGPTGRASHQRRD